MSELEGPCKAVKCLIEASSPFTLKVASSYLSPLITRAITGLPSAPGIAHINAQSPTTRGLAERLVVSDTQSLQTQTSTGSSALVRSLSNRGYTCRVIGGYLLQYGLLAFALNSLYEDITLIMFRFKWSPDFGTGLGGACVAIMSSANMASYFSMILVYCLFDDTKSDGQDGKSFIFGHVPQWIPLKEQLMLFWMLFGVPEMFEWRVLSSMDLAPRIQLLMLHCLYMPCLRLILIVVGVPTILAYCWITFPLAAFSLFTTKFFHNVMWRFMEPSLESKGFTRKQQNALDNCLRWNLVLPVVLLPNLAFGTAMGVNLYLGEGYMGSLWNSLRHPGLLSYLFEETATATHGMDKVFQLLR